MKPYYRIYRVGERMVNVTHATATQAAAEAERLAAQHPGSTFEVLQCIATASCTKPSTFWMDGFGPEQVTTDKPESDSIRLVKITKSPLTVTPAVFQPEQNPTIAPGEGYRLLEPGELVKEGDEAMVDGSWTPSTNIGGKQASIFTYRRKLLPKPRKFPRKFQKGDLVRVKTLQKTNARFFVDSDRVQPGRTFKIRRIHNGLVVGPRGWLYESSDLELVKPAKLAKP